MTRQRERGSFRGGGGLPYLMLCATEREGEARATATSAAPDSGPTPGHSRPSPVHVKMPVIVSMIFLWRVARAPIPNLGPELLELDAVKRLTGTAWTTYSPAVHRAATACQGVGVAGFWNFLCFSPKHNTRLQAQRSCPRNGSGGSSFIHPSQLASHSKLSRRPISNTHTCGLGYHVAFLHLGHPFR
jgi:hypothetical protein